jgi:predicted nucleic acid-binding protein
VTRLVIDASVAVKWVVAEEGTADALSMLSAHRLSAPDLLVAECSNILWKKVRLGELDAEEAMLAARLLERAEMELHPMRALLEPATRIAINLDHPAYECIYLALARANRCRFVTADSHLVAKVRQKSTELGEMILSLREAAEGGVRG